MYHLHLDLGFPPQRHHVRINHGLDVWPVIFTDRVYKPPEGSQYYDPYQDDRVVVHGCCRCR